MTRLPPRPLPFEAGAFFSALLKQLYIDQQYVPRSIYVPVDFADRATLATLLCERTGHKIEIAVPQRGEKRSLVDLAGQNAKQSYDQRFRVYSTARARKLDSQEAACRTSSALPEIPRRIECFDISHIQGAETVASMVVWEDGAMNKSAYRKFQIQNRRGSRRFRLNARGRHPPLQTRGRRKQADAQPPPHRWRTRPAPRCCRRMLERSPRNHHPAARLDRKEKRSSISMARKNGTPSSSTAASPECCISFSASATSPTASPSPTITASRPRRCATATPELLSIPGVGSLTRTRLVEHFGSVRSVKEADIAALTAVVPRKTARHAIYSFFHSDKPGEMTTLPILK